MSRNAFILLIILISGQLFLVTFFDFSISFKKFYPKGTLTRSGQGLTSADHDQLTPTSAPQLGLPGRGDPERGPPFSRSGRSDRTKTNRTSLSSISASPSVQIAGTGPWALDSGTTLDIEKSWTLTRRGMLSEGPNATISKRRQDLLLLVKKLALFAVREVNKRISDSGHTECSHWWVNVLSVTKLVERNIYDAKKLYGIKFHAQPGNVPFEANILSLESKGGFDYTGQLIFVNASRLDMVKNCSSVSQNLQPICLCLEEKIQAEKITAKLRFEWQKTDTELFSWPPSASMFVADYITLGTEKLYVKSPSNKTEFCDPKVNMIVFISSAPTHTLQRATIRKTFGNPKQLHPIGARLLFLFGKITNKTLQAEIDLEFDLYEDIVQADYADSYHNLSLSHLSMYNWVVTRCQNGLHMPKWVLKADDDIILNVPLAQRVAKSNPDVGLLGTHFCGTKAIRDVSYMRKYYVPRYMYSPDWYIGYLSGVAYLVQTNIFKAILSASKFIPLTHMDDAYVMGLLTKEAQIRPRHSPLFTYRRITPDPCGTKLTASSSVQSSADMEVQWGAMTSEPEDPDDCFLDESFLEVIPLSLAVNRFCFF